MTGYSIKKILSKIGNKEAVNTNVVGVTNTLSATRVFDNDRGTTMEPNVRDLELLRVEKECIITSMTFSFDYAPEDPEQHWSTLELFDGSTFNTYRTLHGSFNPSGRITSRGALFDGMFEYLGQQGARHFVALKYPILVKGFRLLSTNQADTEKHFTVQVTWSERG